MTLLSRAMIEIRLLANRPEHATHPDGHLAQIAAIADVCHHLPGAGRTSGGGLVWTWQTADEFQRAWLRSRLAETNVDIAFLEAAPAWPPPGTAPDLRPSWNRWRWPRDPGAFVSVDSDTLARLVRQGEPDGPHALLDHLHPGARHIIRARRPGETLFRPDGPGDVRQYRAVVTMRDGALIVASPRLRAGDIAALPANLGLFRRLVLAAVPKRRRERDLYVWGRDHHL
ncbi:hypothetical protein SAMN05421684_8455 [Asanoa ishikariensis]|uniref:Uncharacterized protein n=1 Tax=Asanoa ishikariensis TaxID=137265 RepID=A0A1H3UYP7_9ACTN|nr:hypothetical protein SAMN05421684_8455 [Asanoa ishikariensis]